MIDWQSRDSAPRERGTEVLIKTRGGTLYLAYYTEVADLGQGEVGPAWQVYDCEMDHYYSDAVPDDWVIAWARVHF